MCRTREELFFSEKKGFIYRKMLNWRTAKTLEQWCMTCFSWKRQTATLIWSWKYFIWIDYPNKESWSRFKTRKANGDIPASATIGGEIGIHGVPDGADSMIADKVNWTLGCISLTNKDIEDLYKSISKSTKWCY